MCSAIGVACLALTSAAARGQTPPPAEPAPAVGTSPELSAEDLAKLKQNPVSGLRQVIFNAVVSPNVPGSGGTEGSYSLQVVWPFPLTEH